MHAAPLSLWRFSCWAVEDRGQSPYLRRKGGREARKPPRVRKEPELNLGEEVAVSPLILISCASFSGLTARALSAPEGAFDCCFCENVGTLGKCPLALHRVKFWKGLSWCFSTLEYFKKFWEIWSTRSNSPQVTTLCQDLLIRQEAPSGVDNFFLLLLRQEGRSFLCCLTA